MIHECPRSMLPSERKRLVARKTGLRVTFSKSPPEIRKFRVEHFVEGRTRRLMNKPRSPAPVVPVVKAETGQNLPPERWLMDTASPFDLTGAAEMSKASRKDIIPASDPAMLHTATHILLTHVNRAMSLQGNLQAGFDAAERIDDRKLQTRSNRPSTISTST